MRVVVALCLLSLTVFVFGGCLDFDLDGVKNSNTLSTSEIEAEIDITATRPGHFKIVARFDSSGLFSDGVLLNGGDQVVYIFNGRGQRLRRDNDSDPPRYLRKPDVPMAEGPIDVQFVRGNGNVFSNMITLRPEFTVTEPSDGQLFTFADTLFLTWTPAELGEIMDLTFYVACYKTGGGTAARRFTVMEPDDGSASLDLSMLPEAMDPQLDTSRDCLMDIEYTRESTTDIDPPFDSPSRLRARQTR